MNALQHPITLLSLLLLVCSPTCDAKVVDSSKAADVANRFLSKNSGTQKALRLRQPTNRHKAPSQTGTEAPAYHLFTGADGKGFVIVAGDDVAYPILGYSPDAPVGTRSSDGDAQPAIPPAMQELLDDLEGQIRQARDAGATASDDVARQWRDAAAETGITVVQMNTAKWDQFTPFNWQCPLDAGTRSATGCATTAYAILMKYYAYPEKGWGVTDAYTTSTNKLEVASRDLNHLYDWANMPLEYISGMFTTAQANNVAQLMADIGAVFKMDYTADNSVTYAYQPGLLAHFGFNPGSYQAREGHTTAEWTKILQDELSLERPIVYRGADEKGNGHIFLLDGYTDKDYFSVNWGWGGECNGLFLLTALTPTSNINLSSGQGATLGCAPSTQTTTAKTVALVDGTTPCPSFEAAIAFAQQGKPMSIKLTDNSTTEGWVSIAEGKEVTLDLNGYELQTTGNIAVYGKLTVTDSGSTGKITLVSSNTGIFSNHGELVIDGGTYENKVPSYTDTDYRRCVWTSTGSSTHIKNGSFTAKTQVCCFNGNATIDDGTFNCTGNAGVILNYGKESKVVINGGTFTNSADKPSGTDFRRSLWADAGTNTNINGGKFTCNSASQTVCINGNGLINSGSIINKGTGTGLSSSGDVKVNYCQVSAPTVLRIFNDASLKCAGGLYSQQVANQFLADGCQCVSNDDANTKTVYPYKVFDPYASPTYTSGKRGDVNGDGQVDVADIADIIDIMAGKEE